MSTQKIVKNYVSEIDQCLQKLANEYPELSLSQQKEIVKYQRIYELRDHAVSGEESAPLPWDDFL